MKRLIIYLLGLCSFGCQDKTICTLTGKVSSNNAYTLIFQGSDTNFIVTPDTNGCFSITIPVRPIPYFTLSGLVEDEIKWQFSSPVYLRPGATVRIDLFLTNAKAEIKPKDDDNKALQQFRLYSEQQNKNLWMNTPAPDAVAQVFTGYLKEAKRIISFFSPDKATSDYLITWANMEHLNAASHLEFIYSRTQEWKVPEAVTENLPSVPQVCDVAYWNMFYDCPMHITTYLKRQSKQPEEQLRLLQEQFKTPALRIEITNRLIEDYSRTYSYSDANYARLEKLSAGLPNRSEILKQYRAKHYSIIGAPVPEISFEDKDGNEHRLSQFKGKYIYMDLWASWCGPCVKEVPHLQNLEKNLKNKDVVFVSISLDSGQSEWIRKMEQLKMSGNQWRATDGTFASMLNVKGIPHFLIYGKDGHLLEYQASPPSHPMTKEKLESLH